VAGPSPIVEQCHINFWSLGALFRRVYVCDVGLQLKAPPGEAPVQEIRLLLPFEAESRGFTDLYSIMSVHENFKLVFGEPLETLSSNPPTYKTTSATYRLQRLSTTESELKASRGTAAATIGTLRLTSAIPPGETAYVRLRLRVGKRARVWLWQRQFFVRRRALIDLRVADLRESLIDRTLVELEDRILPVAELYMFVIADWALQHRVSSPPLRHIRVLEGRVWEPYLNRATDLRRKGKLVIYYWKSTQETTAVNPFRAFLDLSIDDSVMSWRHLAAIALVIGLALWVQGGGAGSDLSRLGNWSLSFAARVPIGIEATVVGLVVLWATLYAVFDTVKRQSKDLWRSARRLLRFVEDDLLYRPTHKRP